MDAYLNSSYIHCLLSKIVEDSDSKSSKISSIGRNVREIILQSSWHKYLKHSKPYKFILSKVKKPLYGFCTHLFFASTIILIFDG